MNMHNHLAPLACLFAACALPLAAQDGPEPSKQPPSDPAGTKVATELMEAAKARIKKTGDTDYELGQIKFSSATREVRVPAVVNMSEGILEYTLVHENGKTHESLLRTAASPTEVNVALLLCHYEPHIKEAAQYLPDPRPETLAKMALPMQKEGANRVKLTVEWKDRKGKEQSAPVGAWIRDKKAGKPMDVNHWTYTGSFISQTGYAAEHDGSIIAIYFDLVSLVNCPDKGNADDDRWFVEKTAVPAIDTPVTLVFSPLEAPAAAPPSAPVSK